jgi:hypothetical protein
VVWFVSVRIGEQERGGKGKYRRVSVLYGES